MFKLFRLIYTKSFIMFIVTWSHHEETLSIIRRCRLQRASTVSGRSWTLWAFTTLSLRNAFLWWRHSCTSYRGGIRRRGRRRRGRKQECCPSTMKVSLWYTRHTYISRTFLLLCRVFFSRASALGLSWSLIMRQFEWISASPSPPPPFRLLSPFTGTHTQLTCPFLFSRHPFRAHVKTFFFASGGG